MAGPMTWEDDSERADRAIFAGEFDHWGSVTVRSGPVVECGVEDCDYLERVTSAHEAWDTGLANEEGLEIVGTHAYQLHLSTCHLNDVINALEDRA